MKKWYSIILLSFVFLFSTVISSSAEISSDELLQMLKEKGIITDKDIENATPSKKNTRGKDSFFVKTPRKPKSINFKGRVQARYTYMEDGYLDNVTHQNAFDESEFDAFSIRRVRLRWYGEVIDKLKYHIQVSVDGDSNADNSKKDDIGLKLQDAYFTYAHNPYFNVTVGQFKSRFSPSYLTSGPVLPLCERPLVVDKISRKREIGISIESAKKGQFDNRSHEAGVHDKPFYYAFGLYNGNKYNHLKNNNDNLMLTSMFVYRPIKYINFGTSYAFNQTGDDDATKRLHIWDFNSALDLGPFHAQIEYIQEHGHGTNRRSGYGIQGQYDLTDTFQLTARYDEYDPDRKVDDSFDSRWYTVGWNWFIHGQDIKWQVNYTVRKEMHGYSENNDILITHFQVLF